MGVFISKFALGTGIVEYSGKVDADGGLWYNPSGKAGWGNSVSRKHVHQTRDAAVAGAEKLRAKKIASLEAQIAKLRAIDFGAS